MIRHLHLPGHRAGALNNSSGEVYKHLAPPEPEQV